jgi:RNA polymerase sigma-70 factor, ECF subfamily
MRAGTDATRQARFDKLVALHTPALTVVAQRLCRDQFAAKDLLQETFLRAWLRLDSLQDDDRARAWLVQIMKNLWLDHLRRRRKEVSLENAPEQVAVVDEPSRWEDVTLGDLHRAIEQLEEPFRSVAVLHDVDGLSYRDIAARLDIPYATAATRLHRAHLKIKQLVLGKLEHEEDP